jgi:hypothetical protein
MALAERANDVESVNDLNGKWGRYEKSLPGNNIRDLWLTKGLLRQKETWR